MSAPAAPPSLTRRVALTVLGAFVGIFALLFVVLWAEGQGEGAGELRRVAQILAGELDEQPGEAAARALFDSSRRLFVADGSDEGPALELAFVPRGGGQGLRTAQLRGLDLQSMPAGEHAEVLQGRNWQLQVVHGRHWTVVLADDTQARIRVFERVLLGDLSAYLAMALPIVLLPVWWLVRQAMKPLRRLSEEVAARAPLETQPLQTPRRWAELLPLQDALDRLFMRTAQGLVREKAFVHDAAHELRTPLAVIATQAHLLAGSEGPSRAEAAQRLLDAVARASHLTQQLLQLARADAAPAAGDQIVDLMDLVRDTMSLMAERAAAQATELDLQGPDQLPLHADKQALRSALDNLLDNALRHGGPGGAVLVRVLVEPAGDECRLVVSDCGPGIAEADRERVFDRFWRAPGTAAQGSGLGLAIVREAVRGLSGSVRVLAQPAGSGASIEVRLPLRLPPAPPRP